MFHGWGADCYDLAPLTDYLQVNCPTRWFFPQGIEAVPIGPGWMGRGWWNIDMQAWQERLQAGDDLDLSESVPAGLKNAREKIFQWIEKLGLKLDETIFAGFSQGAMLSVDLMAHAPATPKGLMLLSGCLINKAEMKPLLQQHQGLQFFQSHGKSDAVLTLKGAERLETFLTQNGLKGKLLRFDGGHEIPPQVLSAATSYLTSL